MRRVFSLLMCATVIGSTLFTALPQTEAAQPKTKTRGKKRTSDRVIGPVYFYSVTHKESTGWIYIIPFCKKLSADEFRAVRKKCKKSSVRGERCETDKTVELKEAGGSKSETFKLDYFAFASEKDCVQDRESYTSGDVVPFH